MSTREISETIKELYDVDVSATLISNVTGRAINEVIQWQNRPLDAVYPVVFMDCIVVKVRDNQRVLCRIFTGALSAFAEILFVRKILKNSAQSFQGQGLE